MTTELIPYMVLRDDTITVNQITCRYTVPATEAQTTVKAMRSQLIKSRYTMYRNQKPIISL